MKTRISRSQILDLAILLLICAVWFAIGWIVRDTLLERDAPSGSGIALVERARHLLTSEQSGEIPPTRDLAYAAIRGMLRKTNDPYAALLTPPVSQRYLDDFAGSSGIIGAFPEKQGGEVVMSLVLPDEPASRAGIRAGDVILAVDGVIFDDDTSNTEVALLIRGPVGTPAHIVVQRGDKILAFDPIRQERPVVSAHMLPNGIAYLTQYTFTSNASQTVKAALLELLAQQPTGLIWDLSSNGGGSVEVAQEVLSFFVPDGLLFSAELRGGEQREFKAQGEAIAAGIPLVVLIGERTYSAAEVAAATIAERGRGILLGNTTHGKGTIQNAYPLSEEVLLKITIARWLSPTGQSYDGRGVTPEITVRDDENTKEDEVLQAAVEYLLQRATP